MLNKTKTQVYTTQNGIDLSRSEITDLYKSMLLFLLKKDTKVDKLYHIDSDVIDSFEQLSSRGCILLKTSLKGEDLGCLMTLLHDLWEDDLTTEFYLESKKTWFGFAEDFEEYTVTKQQEIEEMCNYFFEETKEYNGPINPTTRVYTIEDIIVTFCNPYITQDSRCFHWMD